MPRNEKVSLSHQITKRFKAEVKERIVRVEKETSRVEAEAKLVAARHAAMIEAFGKQVRPYGSVCY